MKKEATTRVGVNFTAADLRMLRKLKAQLEAERGKLSMTAVLRIVIRQAVQP